MRTLASLSSGILVAALLLFSGGGDLPQAALAQPGNDSFAGAVTIAALPFGDSLSTLDATTEAGEPSQCGPEGPEIGATVWYAFTSSKKAVLEANTSGSSYDTVQAAYTGSSLTDLVQLACNDDTAGLQSRVLVTAEGGQTIFFQAGGFFGDSGDLVFNVLKSKAFPSNKPLAFSGTSTNADASFFSVDGSGVETSTFVSASDFTFTDPSGTGQGSEAFVDIFQFDPGNLHNPNDDTFREFFGFAELAPAQFQANGNLDSASLSAVVNVCEITFEEPKPGRKPPPPLNCFDVAVDVAWTGIGDDSTASGKSMVRIDGCRIRSTFSESFRSADVTGTVIGDTTDFTAGTQGFGGLSSFSFKDTFSGNCGFF